MWPYGFLEISHLANNLEWVCWDWWRSGQSLQTSQWFICPLSFSLQVSCCLLNQPEFYVFLSRAEVISQLTGLHLSTLEVNNVQNQVSMWQSWTGSPTITSCKIILSVLTNGKPIEIEKPMVIPQLKTLPKAVMWSKHFGTMFNLPPWLPEQIWSFGMGDMLCQLVTQGGTKTFVVLPCPLNPLALYLQVLGPSLQL